MAIKEKKQQANVWKSFVLIFTILVVGAAIGVSSLTRDVRQIDIAQEIIVDIPEGAGSSMVAELLEDNGIIKYPAIFKLCSRLGAYDGRYQPGTVTISPMMSYNDILGAIVVSERDSIKVTIPEGYTIKQIAEVLSEAGVATSDEFYAALNPDSYDYRFLKDLPQRDNRMEGYLFPATYDIAPGMSAQEIVNLMLKTFDECFTDGYYARAKERNMTVDQVVTLASVIERETNADTERAKVAGVFYNRLKDNMPLQSCATVQYVLGENKPVLSIEDTQIDSPYNTYKFTGLPIGPIASPGADCIKAVLYPEDTDAYYFCLGKNGEHIFSRTYEEHTKAMEASGL